MKRSFFVSLFSLLMVLTPTLSHAMGAQFYLEPSVGYRNETLRLTDLLNQETQFKASPLIYGLKVGYQSLIGVDISLAGDYSKGSLDVARLNEKYDYTHQSASVQLGVNAISLLKIYLGYSFFNEFKVEDGPSIDAFKLNGPAYIAGVQFKLFPLLYIGAQYNLNQYNKVSGLAYTNGDSAEKYFSKIDSQDYSIYLSLAF